MLSMTETGATDGAETPIVLAHGFSQNSRCWGRFGQALAQRRLVRAIDAPGHGASGYDDLGLQAAGDLIVDTGGVGHYLGYSMGGRMLLHALQGPRLHNMRSLVVIGATGGIDDVKERGDRVADDEELAQDVISLGTEAFVDRWLASPLFAELTPGQAVRSERLANRAEGLAASLRNCGTGRQVPLWDDLRVVSLPVLVVAGRQDHKFTALGERLASTIGDNAEFVIVDGGHAVHLENPGEVAQIVSQWLDQIEAG